MNATPYDGEGYEYSYTKSPEFTSSASPDSVLLKSAGNASTVSNITVVYTFTSPAGSEGFYDISYTNNCPPFAPLAVGYAPMEADFLGFFLPSSCMISIPFNEGVIVGTGGSMSYTYIGIN